MKKFSLIFGLAAVLLICSLYSCDTLCEHSYETVTVEATCTTEGRITSVCKDCGDRVESILPIKGHDFTFAVSEPDCTTAGYTKYTCECGFSYKSAITAPKGHDYTSKVTAPTCTDSGYTTYKCNNCSDSYVSNMVDAMGHDFTASVTAPTCTESGYTTYKCNNCSDSYVSDTVAPTGHALSSSVTAPTCLLEGYTEYSCSSCDYSYTADYVKPLGHAIEESITAPTCAENGFTTYACSACDYSYTADYVKPLGHSTEPSITLPTCTDMGFTTHACSVCDFEFLTDYTEPTGHSFESEVISMVSCTQSGEEKFTCDCGYGYSLITAPLGHSFEATVVNPTVSDMGYTEYSCDCGFNYIGSYRFYDEILDNAYANNDKVLAHGIDISSYNHTVNSSGEYEPIDWFALKEAGVDYVILKIGSTIRDGGARGGIEPTFEMDYAGAKAAGIDVGVYFFTYSTTVSGIRKDAEMLLTYLEGKQFEYPIYLDLEPAEDENYAPQNIAAPILTEMLLTFFSTLQKEGYYTGLYINNEFLFNILQTDNIIELFEIWYARPPRLEDYAWNPEDSESFVWNTEKYGEHLGMWQYCWNGQLSPITTNVDFDYAYKDYPSIIKQYGFNGY